MGKLKLIYKLGLFSLVFLLYQPIEVNAESTTDSASGITTVSGDGGKGNATSESTYELQDNGTVEIITHKTGSNYEYQGEDNEGHFKNPSCTGTTATDAVLAAGATIEQINAFMQETGIHMDLTGNWKTKDGMIVNVIKLQDILGIKRTKDNPAFVPDPKKSPHVSTSRTKYIWTQVGKKSFLQNISIDNTEFIYLGEDQPFHYSQENPAVYKGYLADSSTKSESAGFHSGNLPTLYENGVVHNNKWAHMAPFEDPKAVMVSAEATFTWITITKEKEQVSYYNHQGAHDHGECKIEGEWRTATRTKLVNGYKEQETYEYWASWHTNPGKENWTNWADTGYIRYNSSTTSTVKKGADACEVLKPEYSQRLPLDLTSLGAYEGPISIPEPLKEAKSAGVSDKLVPIEIVEKNSNTTDMVDQEFKIVGNNTAATFSVKWNSDLFGVSGEDENITFEKDWKSKGYSNIVEGWFVYGADTGDAERDPVISSITKVNGGEGDELLNGHTYFVKEAANMPILDKFFVRNILSAESGEFYTLGTAGNNVWYTEFEKKVDNLRGEKVTALATDTPGVCELAFSHEWERYSIYDYFLQPVLYGKYSPLNPAGQKTR